MQTNTAVNNFFFFSGKSHFNYTADVYIINEDVIFLYLCKLFISMFPYNINSA